MIVIKLCFLYMTKKNNIIVINGILTLIAKLLDVPWEWEGVGADSSCIIYIDHQESLWKDGKFIFMTYDKTADWSASSLIYL